MITPTQEYRCIGYRPPKPLLKGVDAKVNSVIGACQRRPGALKRLMRDAQQVDSLSSQWKDISTEALREKLVEFRDRYRRGGELPDDFVLRSLAALREASTRVLGLRPFIVQLTGALALNRGYLAEMATGEGKTLTAGMAGVLAGWTRRPCHVLTVNDYLVKRDAEWLRTLYEFCGLTAGYVIGETPQPERQLGYACDVTYTTSKELLADFLRDRLRLGEIRHPARRLIRSMVSPVELAREGLVLRGLHTAIVDEADSILIDEAVTPLIISTTHSNDALKEAAELSQDIVADLESGADYSIDLKYKEVELTSSGRRKLEERCAELPGLWRGEERRTELVRQSLVAREFFHRDKHYIIQENKVIIVDEFTGRPMPQRTWREGMHQAIEAKEGLPISDPSETVARLSFQRFFRCFHKLSGMSGTAREGAGELWQIYRLPVVRIPTNRPCIRQHWPDRVFATDAEKWEAVAREVLRIHQLGRPVLVGTRSVFASERLATMLEAQGLQVKVINAVRLQEEAEIVERAGDRGSVTIATNMAGRGTDIKLASGVAALGGLHVIATERHESRRVDRQLFGRSGRQGDPGSAQAFVSAEDELIRRYLPATPAKALRRALNVRLPIQNTVARAAFRLAERRAQRLAAKQRAGILSTDTWLDQALSFAAPDGV